MSWTLAPKSAMWAELESSDCGSARFDIFIAIFVDESRLVMFNFIQFDVDVSYVWDNTF